MSPKTVSEKEPLKDMEKMMRDTELSEHIWEAAMGKVLD